MNDLIVIFFQIFLINIPCPFAFDLVDIGAGIIGDAFGDHFVAAAVIDSDDIALDEIAFDLGYTARQQTFIPFDQSFACTVVNIDLALDLVIEKDPALTLAVKTRIGFDKGANIFAFEDLFQLGVESAGDDHVRTTLRGLQCSLAGLEVMPPNDKAFCLSSIMSKVDESILSRMSIRSASLFTWGLSVLQTVRIGEKNEKIRIDQLRPPARRAYHCPRTSVHRQRRYRSH